MDIVELDKPSAKHIHIVWMYNGVPVTPLRMTMDEQIVIHKEASIGKSCNTSDLEIKKAMFDDLIKNYHYCSGDAKKPKIASLKDILEELKADKVRMIFLVSEEQKTLELAKQMVAKIGMDKQAVVALKPLAEEVSNKEKIKARFHKSVDDFINFKKKNG